MLSLEQPLTFSKNITIDTKNRGTSNFNIGIWMFNQQKVEINSIANWINVTHMGKTILEPINVIWIDCKATNVNQANNNVTSFLNANNIYPRTGSSEGYFALFENENWVIQFDKTWSNQSNHATINNHGRIFLSQEVISDNGEIIFVSSGAFSYENPQHYFLSFKNAIDELDEKIDWKIYKEKLLVGNIINTNTYNTFDHEGVKVFINQ